MNPSVQVGQTVALTAAVALQAGASGTPTIQWTSANEDLATVSGNGTTATVSARKVGDPAITATATLGTSTAQGTATVHIVAAPGIKSVELTPADPTIQVQQTVQLTATVVLDAGASGTPTITWTSADEIIAQVAGNGATAVVTGKAAGEVNISATVTLGTSTALATAKVHVVAAPQPIQVKIQVSGAGSGSGQVTSSGIPGGDMNCTISNGGTSGTCQANLSDTDGEGSLSLRAAATGGGTFGSWSGCGAGSSGTTCVLTWDSTNDVTFTVTARFDPPASPPILGVDELIVFDNDSDGDFGPATAQIWVMNNTSTFAVTTGNGINTDPSWSPDGQRIVFRTKRADLVKGDIWVMNADGTGAALLSSSIDYDHDPDWSSTNRVVWVSDRRGDDNLYWVDVATPSVVNEVAYTPGVDELEPAWSPDGSKIVYTVDISGNTQLYVVNADGTNATPLTSGSSDEEPSWTPDGTKIVFTRNNQIWIMDANGSGQTQLTSGANDGSPIVSPDGAKVAFIRGPTNAKRLYVLFLGSTGAPQTLGPPLSGEIDSLDWVRKP